jgi:hypothetical protein
VTKSTYEVVVAQATGSGTAEAGGGTATGTGNAAKETGGAEQAGSGVPVEIGLGGALVVGLLGMVGFL